MDKWKDGKMKTELGEENRQLLTCKDGQTNRKIYRQTDGKKKSRQMNRMNNYTDEKIGRQENKKADRQTNNIATLPN